ncbi:MAG: choice-of-anchor Q domain-containing protein [Candidatus Cloacimonadota bacterium]|nr:choice-of-anchor Q domain-containing protein [Candidatus Cloacimonadota bacterium]
MQKNTFLTVIFIISFFSFSFLFSNTIIVDINGGGDYTTIQEGINEATDGDTVLVYTGIYIENINYNGKNITVASLYLTTQNDSYIDSTIIDGNQNGSVVTFNGGEDSTAILCGFTIQNGSGSLYYNTYIAGGGIYIMNSNPTIQNCIVTHNKADWGAGLFCVNGDITLKIVTICRNHAFSAGGGIHLRDNSTLNLSSINRCNMYENYAGDGSEIFCFDSPEIHLIVDTFTVIEPTSDFILVYPQYFFTYDILNAKIEPVNHDLYVSPDGDNTNSGLSENEPLKNISFALMEIASDSTYPNTIFLSNGIYSSSLTDEKFSFNCRSYISIIGEDEENTILDAENLSNVFYVCNDNNFFIENLTIQNGNIYLGGGIYFYTDSNPTIKNVTLKNNTGGAIYCRNNCNPIFENVKIKSSPIPVEDVAISLYLNCNPAFINSIIEDNYNVNGGTGAIYCNGNSNPILINTKIINNKGLGASGITVYNGSEDEGPILINCTICNNLHCDDGTIRQLFNTNLTLINCILRNYAQDEIYFNAQGGPDTVTISYTNIDGGIGAINTNNNGTINWLEGNIDADPMFVDTLNNNYQLLQGSPCIDAGTPDTTGLNLPETDLAGNPRIYNGRIDIGAYEWQGQGIEQPDTSFINKLYLFQNKPNPFSSSTTITFISANYERLKDYKLSIYNAKGQLVRTYNGEKHNFWVKTDIVWDGTGEDGHKVPSGVYFYKLIYGNNSVTRKMIFMR